MRTFSAARRARASASAATRASSAARRLASASRRSRAAISRDLARWTSSSWTRSCSIFASSAREKLTEFSELSRVIVDMGGSSCPARHCSRRARPDRR
jgi:hypothetical protein